MVVVGAPDRRAWAHHAALRVWGSTRLLWLPIRPVGLQPISCAPHFVVTRVSWWVVPPVDLDAKRLTRSSAGEDRRDEHKHDGGAAHNDDGDSGALSSDIVCSRRYRQRHKKGYPDGSHSEGCPHVGRVEPCG